MGDALNSMARKLVPQVAVGGGGQVAKGAAVGEDAVRVGAAAAATVWRDDRPIVEQMGTYPTTCFLVIMFATVFAVMWHKRVPASALGSSYRQVVVRSELWRVLTAAFVHSGVLHLGFNIASLWRCRRLETALGSWDFFVSSIHILIIAESCEQCFNHIVHRAGGLVDGVSVGYSGVVFAWMTVLSLQPDAATQTIAGVEVGAFTYVMLNLFVMKIIVRRSSAIGHLAGVCAGLMFAAGGLNFLRTRYWGAGVAAWAIVAFLGSLKATAGINVPLVDYLDISGGNDLGLAVIPFDWSSRQMWEDYALSYA